MKLTTHSVYCLTNPLSSSVFYIGRTAWKISSRLKSHISEAKIKDSLKNRIINNILQENLVPVITLLEEIKTRFGNNEKAAKRERYWIKYFSQTDTIVNIVSNPVIWTKEYRNIQCGSKNRKQQQPSLP